MERTSSSEENFKSYFQRLLWWGSVQTWSDSIFLSLELDAESNTATLLHGECPPVVRWCKFNHFQKLFANKLFVLRISLSKIRINILSSIMFLNKCLGSQKCWIYLQYKPQNKCCHLYWKHEITCFLRDPRAFNHLP